MLLDDTRATSVCARWDQFFLPPYGGLAGGLNQMLADLWWNLARTNLLVGENDYQQELSKRGFWDCLTKKVWYLSDYDSRKSKQILKYIAQPFRRHKVYKESVDYGKCQYGKTTGQGFGKVLRCTSCLIFNVSTRLKTIMSSDDELT